MFGGYCNQVRSGTGRGATTRKFQIALRERRGLHSASLSIRFSGRRSLGATFGRGRVRNRIPFGAQIWEGLSGQEDSPEACCNSSSSDGSLTIFPADSCGSLSDPICPRYLSRVRLPRARRTFREAISKFFLNAGSPEVRAQPFSVMRRSVTEFQQANNWVSASGFGSRLSCGTGPQRRRPTGQLGIGGSTVDAERPQ